MTNNENQSNDILDKFNAIFGGKSNHANCDRNSNFRKICQELFRGLNLLYSNPKSDSCIEFYARSIIQISPELTPEILRILFDRMITCEYDFNSYEGIRNIYKAYNLYLTEGIEPNQ